MYNNVYLRVLDINTGQVVQSHTSHNSATNSMIYGIARYLVGDGSLGQAPSLLSRYVPKYISLGTMGLYSQEADDEGLPIGIGDSPLNSPGANYKAYIDQRPGYGADGYDINANNSRPYLGLGYAYTTYKFDKQYNVGDSVMYRGSLYTCINDCISKSPGNQNFVAPCPSVLGHYDASGQLQDYYWVVDQSVRGYELVCDEFPRTPISFREVVPEYAAENAETIDVVYSAMISVGSLAKFRGSNKYLFITEAGLWGTYEWSDGSSNGLLAGYRIIPSDESEREVCKLDNDGNILPELSGHVDAKYAKNRKLLQQKILRVGENQVVQVIWKIQIGSIDQLGCKEPHGDSGSLYWNYYERTT